MFRLYPRTVIAASLSAVLVPWAVQNYQTHQKLGRSAFHPLVAWAIATVAKPFGRETLSTDEYDLDVNRDTWLKGGEGAYEIPKRGRPRPYTGWHFLPHRQVDQLPGEDIKSMMSQEFARVKKANADIIELQTSLREKMGEAIMIKSSIPTPHKAAEASWREIVHLHEQNDFSMHVTLSPQDCKLVIEQGWGERHPFSGRFSLPKENLLIYAPQTEDDVRIAGLIMRASIGFMTGSRTVQSTPE